MPIYEYQCPQCQAVFEEWVSVSEATDTATCPQCGAEATHIISNTAFVLKGGGWYVTDYGNRKNDSAADSGKDSAAVSPKVESTAAPAASDTAATASTSSTTPSSGGAASTAA